MTVTRDEFDALSARVAAIEAHVGIVPSDGGADPETWTVRQGDTLSAIADATGTTVPLLVEWNAIPDPDRIYVGQVLRLTAPDPEPQPDPDPDPQPGVPNPPTNLRADVDPATRMVRLAWDPPA